MPASAPTSQGDMKCLMGGCLGVDEDAVEEMEVVDGVGELVLNFLKVGSSSSWRGCLHIRLFSP